MKKNSKNSVSKALVDDQSGFGMLPIEAVGTSWAFLRLSGSVAKASPLRDMPIRVVFLNDRYEVIDGFKRLERWKQSGWKQVPVVVERCKDEQSSKRLMLAANSGGRTLGALDEARVINSLIEEDGLGISAVANLLHRRREWVIGRRALLRLSSHAQQLLESRQINLSVARLLTALSVADQDAVLAAIMEHGLSSHESQCFIQTWRSASLKEKPALLADPLLNQPKPQAPSLSVRAQGIESRLSALKKALIEFGALVVPPELIDAEQRRLRAICISVRDLIIRLAESFLLEKNNIEVIAMPGQEAFNDDSDSFENGFFPCPSAPLLSSHQLMLRGNL